MYDGGLVTASAAAAEIGAMLTMDDGRDGRSAELIIVRFDALPTSQN